MSRGSRNRDSDYIREDRRSRASDPNVLDSRVYIGGITAKNASYREINDWMNKYGKVLDVTFCDRYILIQFDRESDARRAIDREKGLTFRGIRFEIRLAHSSDGSMGGRSELPRSRSPRNLPYDRSSRELSPGYRDLVRDRSPIERDRYYKERRTNSPDYRGFERPRPIIEEEKPRSNIRQENVQYPNIEYQEPNWNAPPLTNKITAERPGFDAAIIVMSSDLLNYAENIEAKLQRQIALTTHIIVLKEESHANACIDDLSNKAVLYAFLVNHMNEKHLSCTLRILYGSGQEHRNMLLANALSFVARNFEDYQKRVRELKSIAPKPNYDPSRMPPGFLAPDDKTIYQLHLLADSRMLTIDELNEVDEFIQKRIQLLAQAEGILEKPNLMAIESTQNNASKLLSGNGNIRDEKALIAQQNQLHSKILNILKPTSQAISNVTDKDNLNSNIEQFAAYNENNITSSTSNPLTNPKVQQALDSLMQSKFRPNVQEQQQQQQVDDSSRNFQLSNQSANSSMNQQSMNQSLSSINQALNQAPMNQVGNQSMNPSHNQSLNPSINQANNQAMNQFNNPNMAMNMNRPMNPMTQPIRPMQPANPYGGGANYSGYFQTPQIGQPMFRPRQPFQPRSQYPGY